MSVPLRVSLSRPHKSKFKEMFDNDSQSATAPIKSNSGSAVATTCPRSVPVLARSDEQKEVSGATEEEHPQNSPLSEAGATNE